nr:Transmembrane transport protein MmpL10 [Kibdelosporangium sp. MJ126-NF4]
MAHEGGRVLGWLSRVVIKRRWLVCVAWVLVAAGLNLAIPQLERVIAGSGEPILPDDAPAAAAFAEMDRHFGGEGTRGIVFLAVANEHGLTAADRGYYADVTERLRHNKRAVTAVQDMASRPELTDALASRDGKALYALISSSGSVGSAEAIEQMRLVREEVNKGKPAGTDAYVTGPSATISDLQTVVDHSLVIITLVTLVVITLILLLIYRSILTAAVVLMTIGVALGAARAVTAYCGLHVFSLSPFTASFMTAIVLGAGTDYSVFLIGRMRELLAEGLDPLTAAIRATRQISGVITGSALTVAVATGFMAVADLGIFWTTGPAIAVSILVTLAVAVTLSPAALAIAAKWGAVKPAAPPQNGRWHRIAQVVVRRPVPVLLAGLLVLSSIAAFYPRMRNNFDQAVMQPDWTESNRGYAMIARHFDLNAINPDFILIQTDHDMRNPEDLAALEHLSGNVAGVPGVKTVRSVTRPLGTTIEEASLGYQSGEVGKRLDEAKNRITDGTAQTDQLSNGGKQLAGGAGQLVGGAGQLADGAAKLSAGAQQAIGGADRLLKGLDDEYAGLSAAVDGSGQGSTGAKQLAAGARQLADALELGYTQAQVAVDGLGLAYNTLANHVVCSLDPVCQQVRAGIKKIWIGERDQLLPGMRQAAEAARRIADGGGQLASGVDQLRAGLVKAREGIVQLSDGQRLFKSKMGELAGGADRLAGGAGELAGGARQLQGGANQLAEGTGQFTGSIQELRDGLTTAAEFLLTTAKEAKDPKVGGFYLPADALNDPRMALASGFYLSSDGKAARLQIAGEHPVGSWQAMETAKETVKAAKLSLPNGPLADARIAATGLSPINLDLAALVDGDFQRLAIIGLVGVFLILVVLLRSLIAPLYLLGSVVLSFATTMGIGVLIWQDLLGHDVDWSIPPIAFVLLVAVGADYNLLLMNRIKQEAPDGSRAGIARSLTATGGVITSAGIIFAASMFALMAGDGLTLAQLGFMVGVGLVLDTFVVRTLIVPAAAALLGRWNWWPGTTRTGTHRS